MCVTSIWHAKSTVLIKCSGKYIEIYFSFKITFYVNEHKSQY